MSSSARSSLDLTLPFWLTPGYRRGLLGDAARCLGMAARPPSNMCATRGQHLRQCYRYLRQYLRNRIQCHHLAKLELIWEAVRDKDPRVVVEVGSYDATDAARLSRMFPAARVYAFEADPNNYPKVLRTAAERGPGLVPVPMAVFDFTGPGTFHASRSKHGEETGRASGSMLAPLDVFTETFSHIKFDNPLTVPTTTLADWAAREGVMTIDLMWMDAQGAELQILRGAGAMLARTHAIYLEVWERSYYQGGGTLAELQDFLAGFGFRMTHTFLESETGDALFQRLGTPQPGDVP